MRSSLSEAVGNIFMFSFENRWLRHLPDFKPVFFRCYIDDVFFVLFSFANYNSKFEEPLPSKNPNISFSRKKDSCLPF